MRRFFSTKRICAYLLVMFLIVLCSCAQTNNNNKNTASAPPIAEMTSDTVTVLNTTATPNGADAWMKAYADVLLDAPNWSAEKGYFGCFTLADVNLNGIPALFFLEGYRIPSVKCGFYFDDGQAVEMKLPENLPIGFELYRDTLTDSFLWLTGGTTYSHAGKPFGDSGYQKEHQWWALDFSNLPAVRKDFYFAWVVRRVWYESDTVDYIDKGFDYWLYTDEGALWARDENIEDLDAYYLSDFDVLDAKQDELFGSLELVSKVLYRNFYDFFTDTNTLNQTLLFECFANWENHELSAWDGHGAEDGWGDDIEHTNIWE